MNQPALFEPNGSIPKGIDWQKVELPVSGCTPQARHAGATGALKASLNSGAQCRKYREALLAYGPLSDHEAARILGYPLSTINSIRQWRLPEGAVKASGDFQIVEWATAKGGTRITKRTRWAWVG